MQLQEIMNHNVSALYILRDETALEMIEAKGGQLRKLQDKLEAIEEAIFLKESGNEEENDTQQEA